MLTSIGDDNIYMPRNLLHERRSGLPVLPARGLELHDVQLARVRLRYGV